LIPNSSLSVLDEVMEAVVERELWPKRREKAISLLQDYHQSGAEIIIISATYQPAVDRFAKRIGDDRTSGIGTPVNITADGITLAEKITTRGMKLERLRAVIGSSPIDVALGDTFADIPLLEQAAHPIAVFPDKTLLQRAEQEGWQILN
jgi:phosphoserine phosphatase